MKDVQEKQEEQRLRGQLEREELEEATRHFVHSLLQTGKSVTLLPVTRIPPEPRKHFMSASREFTRGWAALVREFANAIDRIADGSSRATHSGEDAHGPAHGHIVVRTHDKD
jgi:hypothetical protein